jgi:arginyl-tRNA synthetase
MLSFEGDTGPYLQYAHARLCSIERGCKLSISSENFAQVNHDLLAEPRAEALIDMISLFPDAVKETAFNKEPTTLVKYCLRLSHCVSSAVTELYVQNQADDVALARLAMYKAARFTLGNGLRMLGLLPLERM